MPSLKIHTSILEWEVIASRSAGPGARIRLVLVHDRDAKATVLFGGVIWNPGWSLQTDTWELRDREGTSIMTSEARPPRHRGAMVYMDNDQRFLLFGGQRDTNELFGDA
jgi:hypothetical protein